MELLSNKITFFMKKYDSNTFIVNDDERITYGQALAKVESFQKRLREVGVKERQTVAVIAKENSIEFIYTVLAIILNNSICSPISPLIAENNGEEIRCQWIIYDDNFCGSSLDKKQKLEEVNIGYNTYNIDIRDIKGNIIAVFPTSGTTGKSKWVPLTHNNILSNITAVSNYKEISDKDVFILAKHLAHISTFTSDLLLSIFNGSSLVMYSGEFNVLNLNRTIMENCVTVMTLVPSMLQIMLRNNPKETLNTLEKISLVGGPARKELLFEAKSKIPWASIYIGYGLTEASSRVTYLPPEFLMDRYDSMGIPIENTKITLMDNGRIIEEPNQVGEVVVSGDGVMMGYVNDSGCIDDINNILYTNDLAYRDDEGFYYHVGRKDDILVINGLNIPAVTIEKIVEQLDEVDVAYALNIKTNMGADTLGLLISVVEGKAISKELVYSHMMKNLSSKLVPKRIWIKNEIPMSNNGKISRKFLAQWCMEKGDN